MAEKRRESKLTGAELLEVANQHVQSLRQRRRRSKQDTFERLDMTDAELIETSLGVLFKRNPFYREFTGEEHTADTPNRVARYVCGLVAAAGTAVEASRHLRRTFDAKEDSPMVQVYDMEMVGYCAHHLLPVMMWVHFAYIPDKKLVGLSKIPRWLKELSGAPNTQENLALFAINEFMDIVAPLGAALTIDGIHTCMACRGVQSRGIMRTTCVRGLFLKDSALRAEYMAAIPPVKRTL